MVQVKPHSGGTAPRPPNTTSRDRPLDGRGWRENKCAWKGEDEMDGRFSVKNFATGFYDRQAIDFINPQKALQKPWGSHKALLTKR